jgi:6-phosphofructokinase 1
VDGFGHTALAGTGRYLESLIKAKLGCKVRSIEFSVLQRSAGHYASETDINEAVTIGEEAVKAAIRGETAVMLAVKRVSNDPYLVKFESVAIEDCAGLEKCVPQEWITDGCDVSPEMVDYLSPLVEGRAPAFEEDGVPSYMFINRDIVKKP